MMAEDHEDDRRDGVGLDRTAPSIDVVGTNSLGSITEVMLVVQCLASSLTVALKTIEV